MDTSTGRAQTRSQRQECARGCRRVGRGGKGTTTGEEKTQGYIVDRGEREGEGDRRKQIEETLIYKLNLPT